MLWNQSCREFYILQFDVSRVFTKNLSFSRYRPKSVESHICQYQLLVFQAFKTQNW
ncbi:unnamed protein product, partial [Nesidiocoris tenuis]